MSSSEPPVMYSTSLWAAPYEPGAPTRLLRAQEEAFLRDIRDAINRRVENKIASARRFAVSFNKIKYVQDLTIRFDLISGARAKSRKDGRLLPDYLL